MHPRGAISAYNVVIQLKVYKGILQGHSLEGAMSKQNERAVAT